MENEEKEKRQAELRKLTFEQALSNLQEIVQNMERGGVPLDEMIRKFEEGAEIAAYCQEKLASLKQKMEILVRDRETGKASWREMTPAETEAGK